MANIEEQLYYKYIKDGKTLVAGIDPGEVDCPVAIFSKEDGLMIDCLNFKLREPKSDRELIMLRNTLADECEKHRRLWRSCTRIVVEFQFGSVKLRSLYKYLIQMTSPERYTTIYAATMRKAYKEHFPSTKGLPKHKSRASNKGSAVIFGKNFVSEECMEKLKQMNIEDKHDIYDALLFAKYFCDFVLDKPESESKPKKKRAPRKKKKKVVIKKERKEKPKRKLKTTKTQTKSNKRQKKGDVVSKPDCKQSTLDFYCE
jgi:hypothetical protein